MKHLLLSIAFLTLSSTLFAQSVGIGTSSPDSSALLDISSTEKGLLIPRMSSANRQSIADPAKGLMVYDTTTKAFYYFAGNGWLELLSDHVDHLEDADGDTKIQVEESADEDIIRFDVGGNERMVLESTGNLLVGGMTLKQVGSANILHSNLASNNYLEFLGNNATRLNADVWLSLQANEQTRILISRFDSIAVFDKTTFHDGVQLGVLSTDATAQKVLLADPAGIIRYTDLAPLKTETSDMDNDTRIQVEENPDEDIIRFDLAGTEYFRMDHGRLEVTNTSNNVCFGPNAGNNTMSGGGNTLLGLNSGKAITTGSGNIGIGEAALSSDTTGSGNIAVGGSSLAGLKTGNTNVSIGGGALQAAQAASDNVALGFRAGGSATGSSNVFLGRYAGRFSTGDHRLYIENTDAGPTGALIYGEFDNDFVRINGGLEVTDGLEVIGDLEVTGEFPVGDLISDSDNDTKIQVEKNADDDLIRFDLQGAEYFSMEPGKFLIKSGVSGLGSSLNLEFREGGDVNRLKSTIPPDIGSTPAGYKLSLEPNNTPVLTATGEGKVGIGITSPEEKLEVGTDTDVSAVVGRAHIGMVGSMVDHAGFGHIDHHGESDYALLQNANGKTMLNAASGQPVEFRINNTTEMTLKSNGDVRIQNKLGIGADPDNLGLVVRRDHEDGFAAHFRNLGYSDPNSTTEYDGIGIQAGRNVNNGANSNMVNFWRPDGTVIGAVTQNNSGTVQYHTTSDERLKTQITPTQFSMGDLMKIEVKDYVYRDEPNVPVTGFIAQQLHSVCPNVVHVGGEDHKADPWMVEYGGMTPYLVKAIQDQQEIIEALEQRIRDLEERN